MSETSQGPGWWLASDGKWYAPELAPQPAAPPPPVVVQSAAPEEVVDNADEEDELGAEDEGEAVPGSGRKSRQKKMRDATFGRSEYLGGLPGTKKASGNLIFDESAVGVGTLHPKKGVVAWTDMAGISFDSATMKKSRAGKAVMFGVFALAAKNTQNAAEITVQLKDSNVALYRVPGKTGAQVRAKVQPFLIAHGVPCLDDAPATLSVNTAPPAPVAPAALSMADEIAKLVALRDSGAITDEEFAAYKANLLP
jgi:hypothetical protein